MKRIFVVLCCCFGLSLAGAAAPCEIIPVNDCIKGAVQSAYRIRVASSRERLGRPDLWDTGKLKSSESAFIPYQGQPLGSGTLVWWQVKVWDGNGKASQWSEPAQWRMGVLNPKEWCAKWIGAPAAGDYILPSAATAAL